MLTLNKEQRLAITRKWVDMLESGEYKQGRNRLVRRNYDGSHSFCCLGVLMLQFPEWKIHERLPQFISDKGGCVEGNLPAEIIRAMKMEDEKICTWVNKLISMNDAEGKSFTEIAEFLKTEYIPYLESLAE